MRSVLLISQHPRYNKPSVFLPCVQGGNKFRGFLAIDGVIKKVVEEANAGVPVPPGDPAAMAAAIRMLASNPKRCQELGKNGRNIVETRFSRN
ncbi:MAG: hypothetical protein U9R53_10390, partial [Chloroflexota bacterium]|nr:hypothetical protein [Chloroflexota bacterium]